MLISAKLYHPTKADLSRQHFVLIPQFSFYILEAYVKLSFHREKLNLQCMHSVSRSQVLCETKQGYVGICEQLSK